MRLILLNSAIMPVEGFYYLIKIDWDTFCKFVKKYKRNIISYIGYQQNADLIKEWTGVEIKVNREAINGLREDDLIFVMKLKYRVKNPSEKGKKVDVGDFEFYRIEYRPLL